MNKENYEEFKFDEEVEFKLSMGSINARLTEEQLDPLITKTLIMNEIFKSRYIVTDCPVKDMLVIAPHKNITKVSKILDKQNKVTGIEIYVLSGLEDNSKYLEHSFILPKVTETDNTLVYKNGHNAIVIENKNKDNIQGVCGTSITYDNIMDWCKGNDRE